MNPPTPGDDELPLSAISLSISVERSFSDFAPTLFAQLRLLAER